MSESDFKKNMVSYTSRDYESLVNEFMNFVPRLTKLWSPPDNVTVWKPEANADPGVILGKWLASVADMLGVNVDWLANEVFAPSVSQRKNAEKLFALIGYDLGWYTAARTEITFYNNGTDNQILDFSFLGNTFSTVTADSDITGAARTITYNILPNSHAYGVADTRSRREQVTSPYDVFNTPDKVTLEPGASVTRVGVEGELRSVTVKVADVKDNDYIIALPSQHVDTTAVWVRGRSGYDSELYTTNWLQVATPAEFTTPEPRFAVTYDNFSNARVQISSYINQLEDYGSAYLTVYWIDCSGVLGCVGENVFSNLYMADGTVTTDNGDLFIYNLANTVELPHTNTVTGSGPETAKQAYANSRNYINTWDSLITLPDFNRFLNREPGVDCGLVIDCQKALEINQSIYNDSTLTKSQKSKMYITNSDFPAGSPSSDWSTIINQNLKYGEGKNSKQSFVNNFKTYTAMCFAIHNNFLDSSWGNNQTSLATIKNTPNFIQYKPPMRFIEAVKADYAPLQAMTVELDFGYIRVFNFYVTGVVYTKKPVTPSEADSLLGIIREALTLYFHPAVRRIGEKPTLIEVVNVIRNADERIDYFDAGSLKRNAIQWYMCDTDYFNPISFARLVDTPAGHSGIIISPDSIIS